MADSEIKLSDEQLFSHITGQSGQNCLLPHFSQFAPRQTESNCSDSGSISTWSSVNIPFSKLRRFSLFAPIPAPVRFALSKVRCFIVYQDYSLFSEGFFQPAEIHRQQRKHRYNAKYTEDQRFFKGTGSNAAQNQRNIPYIMRKIPAETQTKSYQ